MNRLLLSTLACAFGACLILLPGCRADPPTTPTEDGPAEIAPETAPDREAEAGPLVPAEEVAELREHRLSVDEVRRYERAAQSLQRMAAEEPQESDLRDLETRLARAETLEEVQQILDQHPRVQQALSAAGISSRDYVLTGTALLGAYSYILMREQGIPDAYRPDYVADEHIHFVERNRAEVDVIVERLQALYGVELD
jgi:hypothetical protein